MAAGTPHRGRRRARFSCGGSRHHQLRRRYWRCRISVEPAAAPCHADPSGCARSDRSHTLRVDTLFAFVVTVSFLIVEAVRSARNERLQMARGGVEPSGDVYKMMRIAYP